MSWSVNVSGTPDEVCDKLLEYGDAQTGASGDEFAASLPHLVGLVRQTYTTPAGVGNNYPATAVRLVAFGSGSTRDGAEQCRECHVKLEAVRQP